ncbi:MAG: hypothetical protein FWC59_03115, partial [Actinomycetia bacterium]|nr:hypothetical protein [Actinomycetes bacterium]
MSQQIAIIDGNSLMHRAFHAVPTYMTAPDGRPTNAVFGFLNMLLKLLEDFQPAGVIVAFDQGIPEFRLAAIQQYKAQRPPTDPDLKSQFPIIRDLLVALEIPVVQVAGWEGDDILGTLAEQARQHAVECLLVTGDKDALQLVDDNTRVVNTRTGLSDVVIYDSAAVRDKWGIDPAQVPDFLGLMGDNSDNIPGVPGIGEKKARALLTEFGSLDQLLAAAAEIPGKVGESLRENADLARASREVATIRRDVPLDCPVAAIHFPSYSAAVATETFQEYALFSQLKRFLRLIEAAPDPKAPAQQDRMSPAMTVQRSSVSTVPDQSGLASAATAQQLPKSPDYFTSSAQANRPAAEASAFQPLLQAEAAWQGLAAALQQAEPVALLLDGATPSGTLFL